VCGIIGYTGTQPVVEILANGLKRLEYRGYDSAGIAVIGESAFIETRKTAGKISLLQERLNAETTIVGTTGIGHTRWATHGKPVEENAHPLLDCKSQIAVVHNGIVENFLSLKADLIRDGHTFLSETDTEVIPHLLEDALGTGLSLQESVADTAQKLRGANAIVVASVKEPNILIGVRIGNAGGLTVGHSESGSFIASDLPAILPHTNTVTFLEDKELVVLSPESISYTDLKGNAVSKISTVIEFKPDAIYKDGNDHFMIKETLEQPSTFSSALRGRVSFETHEITLDDLPFTRKDIQNLQRVILVGMGTSYNACAVGKHWFERIAHLPTDVDNSSEFRYRSPVIDSNTLVIAIGQSGETADTLAAMEHAKSSGARLLTICNIPSSQAARMAEGAIYIRAGIEIGVASTKTFTSTLTTLYLLSLHIATIKETISAKEIITKIQDLSTIPHKMGEILASQEQYAKLSQQYSSFDHFFYLGRGIHYPIALEGALKLKEVSYIHAEGYPAGEMKHGPIALIDQKLVVVAIALQDELYNKMLGNIAEVKARNGIVIALGTEEDVELQKLSDHFISIPDVPTDLSPLLSVIPLQLFSYHMALSRGCDVDQPRNLAKTVTVE
jgi:glucosamine--fructose-6-phosphate aminotransferase (isomerizing)